MRLLSQCPKCQRQYAASEKHIGRRFRCVCGDVLTVQKPRTHASRVVRCSACGAARQGDEAACGYCNASFTIHERDLHTMCPACASRIPDTARYCYQCGTPIQAGHQLGKASEYACPACEDRPALQHRSLGAEQLAVLECQQCAGLWLHHHVFEGLLQRARTLRPATTSQQPAQRRSAFKQSGPMYRRCVQCHAMMNRNNYRRSGIIIDVCRTHGIWFDAHELEDIIGFMRRQGVEALSARGASARAPASRGAARTDSGVPSPTLPDVPAADAPQTLLDALWDVARDALR
mgnify:CR=1 FL=1